MITNWNWKKSKDKSNTSIKWKSNFTKNCMPLKWLGLSLDPTNKYMQEQRKDLILATSRIIETERILNWMVNW